MSIMIRFIRVSGPGSWKRRLRVLSGVASVVLLIGTLLLIVSCDGQREFARRLGRIEDRVTFFAPTQERLVALTIDDGPVSGSSEKILDVLRERNAHATFFLIGGRVGGHESIVKRMVEEGHELGNHTWDARASIQVPIEELEQGMRRTHRLLETYGPIRWFRPGSGFYNDAILERAASFGYRTVLGDVFPYDTTIQDSSFHVRFILDQVRPGSIIVLHDAAGRGERTAVTLRRVVPILQEQGYRLVTLTELLGTRQKK